MQKVVGYVRVSRMGTKYEEKESPEMQRKAIREFCNREGYSLEHIYEDLDYSGGNDKRPDFRIMMNKIKTSDEIKGIVVYNLSRFSRDIRDILKYLDVLNQNAASFMSVTETFFQMKDTAMRNLMINIFATIADFQRDQTRETVRDSMRSMSERGIHLGGKVPFGYKLDSKKRYIIDEEAAKIVRLIFDSYMLGNSPAKIAGELTSVALLENDLVFNKDTIRSILTNEKYTGRYVYGKTRNTKDGKKEKVDKSDWITDYEENHPPIISKDFFESVQSEIEKRRRNNSNKESVNDIRGENLLTGKIRCAECGSHYRVTSSSSAKRYFYYTCSKSNKEIKCTQGKIRKVQLEELVINFLATTLTLDELHNYYREEYLRVKARVKIDKDNLQPMMQKVQDLEKRKSIFNELLIDAKEKNDTVLINNYQGEIRNLMGQINDLQEEILNKNIKFEMKDYPDFEEIISSIGNDFEDDLYNFIKSLSSETVKSIIHSFINEIIVEDIENSNESRVSITFRDSSIEEKIIERGVRNLPDEYEFDDDDDHYDTLVLLTNVMKEMKDKGWDFPI